MFSYIYIMYIDIYHHLYRNSVHNRSTLILYEFNVSLFSYSSHTYNKNTFYVVGIYIWCVQQYNTTDKVIAKRYFFFSKETYNIPNVLKITFFIFDLVWNLIEIICNKCDIKKFVASSLYSLLNFSIRIRITNVRDIINIFIPVQVEKKLATTSIYT